MLAFPVDATGRSRVSFWRECLAPYQQAFCTLLRKEVAAGPMAIDDIEPASSQFFNLVAAEPFIRTLLDADGGPTPPAGRTGAVVGLFLPAFGRGPPPSCGALNPTSSALPPPAGSSTFSGRGR